MPSTLAQLEARTLALLYDAAAAVFSTATVDECLRQALHEYSRAAPLTEETTIILPADGREIALSSITGLVNVHDVWWPYDSTAGVAETWPPNKVAGFRMFWDDGLPVLFLNIAATERFNIGAARRAVAANVGSIRGAGEPKKNDQVRLFYTADHTIQNLDAAATTTIISAAHESLLVTGAAGYCCRSRSVDLAETAANQAVSTPNYAALAARYLREFRAGLLELKTQHVRGDPYGPGWRVDKWDGVQVW